MNVISSSRNDKCFGMMACKKVAATCVFLASGHGSDRAMGPQMIVIPVADRCSICDFRVPKANEKCLFRNSSIHVPSHSYPYIYISICHHCIYTCTYLYMCIYIIFIILSHYYLQHNTRSCYVFIHRPCFFLYPYHIHSVHPPIELSISAIPYIYISNNTLYIYILYIYMYYIHIPVTPHES